MLGLCLLDFQIVCGPLGCTEEAEFPQLDVMSAQLGQDDARVLVDLLKLAVAGRAGDTAKGTLTNFFTGTHSSSTPLDYLTSWLSC